MPQTFLYRRSQPYIGNVHGMRMEEVTVYSGLLTAAKQASMS